jgi:hypothetical protein
MFTVGRSIIVSFVLLLGVFLGLNAILALPLIDEDKTKTKELGIELRDDINTLRTTFSSHLLELKYDTLTLARFDELNKAIGYNNTSASLITNLSNKIINQKMILDNQVDIVYYNFLTQDLIGINAKKKFKNELLKAYKDLCSKAEKELFLDVTSIRINVLRLYNTVKGDDSNNYTNSKNEFKTLLGILSKNPIEPDSISTKYDNQKSPVMSFFFLSNMVIKDESQTLAVMLGLIGLGLLGAVIGTFSRYVSSKEENTRFTIANGLFSTIIKSFSASVISYLSIKGGLSIVSDNNDTNPNPYFILFVCFIAAVYSEEIWEWAKKRIIPQKA